MPAEQRRRSEMLRGIRVLLIEDSWHVAHALQLILESLEVVVAGPCATIAQAETVLGQSSPDAAIVDINLQGEMAYGLIGNLHERAIPVIIVSGYEVAPALKHRVAAVLSKPVRAETLLATLRAVIAKKDAAQ